MSSLPTNSAGNPSDEASAEVKVAVAEFQSKILLSPEEQALQQAAFSALMQKADPANLNRITTLAQQYVTGSRVLLAGAVEIDEAEGLGLIENEKVAAEMLRLIGDEEALRMAATIERQIVEARGKFRKLIESKRASENSYQGISEFDISHLKYPGLKLRKDFDKAAAETSIAKMLKWLNGKLVEDNASKEIQHRHVPTKFLEDAYAICDFTEVGLLNQSTTVNRTALREEEEALKRWENGVAEEMLGHIRTLRGTEDIHYVSLACARISIIDAMKASLTVMEKASKNFKSTVASEMYKCQKRAVDRFIGTLHMMYAAEPVMTSDNFSEIASSIHQQRQPAYNAKAQALKRSVTKKGGDEMMAALMEIDRKAPPIGDLPLFVTIKRIEEYFRTDMQVAQRIFANRKKIPDVLRNHHLSDMKELHPLIIRECKNRLGTTKDTGATKPEGKVIGVSGPIQILPASPSKDAAEPEKLVAFDIARFVRRFIAASYTAMNVLRIEDIDKWKAVTEAEALNAKIQAVLNPCTLEVATLAQNITQDNYDYHSTALSVGKIVKKAYDELRAMSHWYADAVAETLRFNCNGLLNEHVQESNDPQPRIRDDSQLHEAVSATCAAMKEGKNTFLTQLPKLLDLIERDAGIILRMGPCTETQFEEARQMVLRDIENLSVIQTQTIPFTPESIRNFIDVFQKSLDVALSNMAAEEAASISTNDSANASPEYAKLDLHVLDWLNNLMISETQAVEHITEFSRYRKLAKNDGVQVFESISKVLKKMGESIPPIINGVKTGSRDEVEAMLERMKVHVTAGALELKNIGHWLPKRVSDATLASFDTFKLRLHERFRREQSDESNSRQVDGNQLIKELQSHIEQLSKGIQDPKALDILNEIENEVDYLVPHFQCSIRDLDMIEEQLMNQVESLHIRLQYDTQITDEQLAEQCKVYQDLIADCFRRARLTAETKEIPPDTKVEKERLLLRLRGHYTKHQEPMFLPPKLPSKVAALRKFGADSDKKFRDFDDFQGQLNLRIPNPCDWSTFQKYAEAVNKGNDGGLRLDVSGEESQEPYAQDYLAAHHAATEGIEAAGKTLFEEVMQEQKDETPRTGLNGEDYKNKVASAMGAITYPKTQMGDLGKGFTQNVLRNTLALYCPSVIANEKELEELDGSTRLLINQTIFAMRASCEAQNISAPEIDKLERDFHAARREIAQWAQKELKERNVEAPKPMDAKRLMFLTRSAELAGYSQTFGEERLRLKKAILDKHGMVIDDLTDEFDTAVGKIKVGYTGMMTPERFTAFCDEIDAEFDKMKQKFEPYKDEPWTKVHLPESEANIKSRRAAGLAALQKNTKGGPEKALPTASLQSRLRATMEKLPGLAFRHPVIDSLRDMYLLQIDSMSLQIFPNELETEDDIRNFGSLCNFQLESNCFNMRCLRGRGVLPLADAVNDERLLEYLTVAQQVIETVVDEGLVEFRKLNGPKPPEAPRDIDTRGLMFASRAACSRYLTPKMSKDLVMAQVAFEKIHGTKEVQEVLEEGNETVMRAFSDVHSYQLNAEQQAAYALAMRTALEQMKTTIRTRFPGPTTEGFITIQVAPMLKVIEVMEAYTEPDTTGIVKLPSIKVVDILRKAMKKTDKAEVPQAVPDAINMLFSSVLPWHFSSLEQIDDLEIFIEQHIRQMSYNAPPSRASLEALHETDAHIRTHLMSHLGPAFEECRTMFKRLQTEAKLVQSNTAFVDLQNCNIENGLPRSIMAEVLCAASANADRELGIPVNHEYIKVMRRRLLRGDPLVTSTDEFIGKASWLYGRTMAIDAIAGAAERGGVPSPEPLAVRAREVNARHYEEAIQMILRKCMPDYPEAADLTLEQIAAGDYTALHREKSDEWAVSRDAIIGELVTSIREVSTASKSGKSKNRVPRDRHATFDHNENNVVQALQHFAMTHLPERIITGTSLMALTGFLEEASFSWSQSVKYDGADDTVVASIQKRIDLAYRDVLERWVKVLLDRQREVMNRVYPMIVLPDPALKPPEKQAEPEWKKMSAADIWKAKFARIIASGAESVASNSLREGAYFASRTQREFTQKKIEEYFLALENGLNTAIDAACAASKGQFAGVPSLTAIHDNVRKTLDSLKIPDGLGTLFRNQLEFLTLQIEDNITREFGDDRMGAGIFSLSDAVSGEWKNGLDALYRESDAGSGEIGLEKIQAETAPIKNRCSAAFVRTVLYESLQGRGANDAIPESVFSLTWIDRIHGVVSRSIDEYVAKEPRRGQFVEDVVTTMFRGARQMALMARLGAAVSQEFATGGTSQLPESVILKMRGIRGVDMLSGTAPDTAALRAEVLQATGRHEDVPMLESERIALDQFLYQSLRHDGGDASNQVSDLIPEIEKLAMEINCGCHMGHAVRTIDVLYDHLLARAGDILEEVIVLHSTNDIDAEQSPDAARLISLQSENDAWIASWPETQRSAEAHAGFLQVVTHWNGSAKAVSDGCRQGILFDPRTIATAVLDAECVRDAREKGIIVTRENGGAKKPGMAVHHHKIRALLDARAAKEIGLRALGSGEIDPRAAAIVVDIHALSSELAALDRTLGSTDEDSSNRDAASAILEQKRSELAQTELLIAELDSMLQETADEAEAALREVPHVIAALNAVITLETKRGSELRTATHQAVQDTVRASQRLMEYTGGGGRDAGRLSEMSASLSEAEAHEGAVRAELELFDMSDSITELTAERDALMVICHEEEPADIAPTYPTDPEKLTEAARRVRTIVDDRRSIQEERNKAAEIADAARRNIERLSSLAADSSVLQGSRNSLTNRRKDIVTTLQQIRELLGALTQGK